MTKLALAPLLAASLALSGCISFGPAVPEQLLTLTATQQLAPGQEQDSNRGRSLLINVPVTPAAIGGQRVPVLTSPTSIAYVKDAQWSEPPARLFARLVSDTVTARTNRVVVSQVQAVGEGNDQLDGELRRFGIDEASRSALVIFDASLTRDGRPGVEKRRFEARVPVTTIESTTVGPALNQAANQVAAQVADWVGGR